MYYYYYCVYVFFTMIYHAVIDKTTLEAQKLTWMLKYW